LSLWLLGNGHGLQYYNRLLLFYCKLMKGRRKIREKAPRSSVFKCVAALVIYQVQLGQVVMPADFPTRLYIVTLVNGSPKIPSWMAHERKRMLCSAFFWRKGMESFNKACK
jgi:hypothetical protein